MVISRSGLAALRYEQARELGRLIAYSLDRPDEGRTRVHVAELYERLLGSCDKECQGAECAFFVDGDTCPACRRLSTRCGVRSVLVLARVATEKRATVLLRLLVNAVDYAVGDDDALWLLHELYELPEPGASLAARLEEASASGERVTPSRTDLQTLYGLFERSARPRSQELRALEVALYDELFDR